MIIKETSYLTSSKISSYNIRIIIPIFLLEKINRSKKDNVLYIPNINVNSIFSFLSCSYLSSLESVPGRRLESHQDLGVAASRCVGMLDLARRSREYALFEDVAADGQFGGSV